MPWLALHLKWPGCSEAGFFLEFLVFIGPILLPTTDNHRRRQIFCEFFSFYTSQRLQGRTIVAIHEA